MQNQPLHQALIEAGMAGEETAGRDDPGSLRARLLRSMALVRSSVSDSLRELIQAASRSGEDPQLAPFRGLAASAKAVWREYESLTGLSLKDWARDVRDTLEPCACVGDRWELQTLREFAAMLHLRLSAPPAEASNLDAFFQMHCEVERDSGVDEQEEAFLVGMEMLWGSLDANSDIPDLPLLLCMDFDEAKCLIARRIARNWVGAGRSALVCHLVPLRTKLARLTERMQAVLALGSMYGGSSSGQPLPHRTPVQPVDCLQLPQEISTAQAAEVLGVSKDTVLLYREKGLLPYRNAAPPGSTKPIYLYPLDAVVKMRTAYQTDEPAPRRQSEPPRRRAKGEHRYKHLDLD